MEFGEHRTLEDWSCVHCFSSSRLRYSQFLQWSAEGSQRHATFWWQRERVAARMCICTWSINRFAYTSSCPVVNEIPKGERPTQTMVWYFLFASFLLIQLTLCGGAIMAATVLLFNQIWGFRCSFFFSKSFQPYFDLPGDLLYESNRRSSIFQKLRLGICGYLRFFINWLVQCTQCMYSMLCITLLSTAKISLVHRRE